MSTEGGRWYSVRCLFQWISYEEKPYEERITLWRATSMEEAVELAESEAADYAVSGNELTYLGFAQGYALDEDIELGSGAEVFSQIRDSELSPKEYLDRFFATGEEHLRHIEDSP
ncbi:hypothetical protein ACIOD2_36860 [Amycolatopsis sp. NPDC088138]|uniref:hypothetical protein n=1 Tax=Amycolatopsis sp. NPDC088138 TaxID=3363938 RepID=UPI00381EEC64